MRKFKNIKIHLSIIMIVFLTSCATQKVSTIVGCDYNEKINQTDYFVLPYGTVSIPGKWEKTNYNSISHQQFFKNADSVIITVVFGPYDKYEFNADKSKKGIDFALAYYEWDSKYFVETHGLKRDFIEKDTVRNFVIYRIYGETEKGKFDSYFLVGEKNGFVSNFSVMETDKWTENYKIDFLKRLYVTEREE
jgi:hypothetical protein